MFPVAYFGGWRKKCPSCGKELWSDDYPEFFKTFDYTKTLVCPKCNTTVHWSKNHTLVAKYGLTIGATFALVFAASAFFVSSSEDINSLKITDPALLTLSVSFFVVIISFFFGVVGMIGKNLVIVDKNA